MSALRSSLTGPFLGSATNRRPQPRQSNWGEPERRVPLRTTWVPRQRGHDGIDSGAGFEVAIPRGYSNPRDQATT